ncbi:MAG: hypothetical protein N2444_11440, partial [Methylocystis sp.]|nr:hypothetical protein [Methylocystis sp.]
LVVNAPTGSTINGASSITVPFQNGVVWIECTAVSGANATWVATGDISDGVVMPGITVLGDLVVTGSVRGARRAVRSTNMTGNLTLASADAGTTIVATGTGTLTVPSDWRGQVMLVNRAGGNVTVTFSGVGSATLANNEVTVIEAFDRPGGVERIMWPPVAPATLS